MKTNRMNLVNQEGVDTMREKFPSALSAWYNAGSCLGSSMTKSYSLPPRSLVEGGDIRSVWWLT